MKITIITHEILNDYDNVEDHYEEMIAESNNQKLEISQAGNLAEDCPEDATFGRSINRPAEYLDIIKMAYEAGRRQELLEIEEITECEED